MNPIHHHLLLFSTVGMIALILVLGPASSLTAAPGGAGAEQAQPLEAGDVVLTLTGSATMGDADAEDWADLDFEFQRRGEGDWEQDVWAFGMNYVPEGHYERSIGKMDNHGQLLNVREDGDSLHLDVAMRFMGHPHVGRAMQPERWGRYTIEVEREGNRFSGRYAGLFNGWPVEGEVEGSIEPPFVKPIEGVDPLEPGERPRLIFREGDLEEIRRRARETPEGRAMLERLRHRLDQDIDWGNARIPPRFAAGYGVLYQITGERDAVEKAREIVERIMAGEGQHARMLQRAPRVTGTALAYDLCYDGWDEAFRREVATWLEEASWDVLNMGGGGGLNDHPHSNWMGIAYSGAGVAAMAVLGDRVDFPDPPQAPPHVRLTPPAEFEPGRDVPEFELEPGEMPRKWLMVGPFDTDAGDDFLKDIGGRTEATPQRHDSVDFDDKTLQWELTTEFDNDSLWQHDHFTGEQPAIDLLVPIDRAYHSTSYYFLALRNPEPGWYRYKADTAAGGEASVLYLAGQRFRHNDVMHLEQGLYPMMIEISVGSTEPWGRILMQPRFKAVSEDEAESHKAIAEAEYLRDLGQWQRDREAWLESGERSVRARHFYERAQRGVARHLRDAVGERGFNIEGEGYLRMTMTLGLSPYLHAQRIAMGERFGDASGQDWAMVLPLITGIGPEGRRATYGPAGWISRGQQEERSGAFAMGMSNVPDEYLPAARWWFDRVFGFEGGNETFNIHMPEQAGYALMNYPFDVEPRNPGDVLPRAVRDRYHEYFAFRSAWSETDEGHASPGDLLAIVYGRGAVRRYVHQASTTPNIRIIGYDQRWADIDRVSVSEDIDGWLWGEATHAELDEDRGDGSVTLDISRQYLLDDDDADEPVDEGVEAKRAFAVDYSGESGAEGLYAVVDTVDGLSGHRWRMQMPGRPDTDGRRFTFTRGGATFSGIVVGPAHAELDANRDGLDVRGGNRFFIVMTLQEGDSLPEMEVTGEGLDARVRVGERTVRFDGERIVID